jgi:hypothetical protein
LQTARVRLHVAHDRSAFPVDVRDEVPSPPDEPQPMPGPLPPTAQPALPGPDEVPPQPGPGEVPPPPGHPQPGEVPQPPSMGDAA